MEYDGRGPGQLLDDSPGFNPTTTGSVTCYLKLEPRDRNPRQISDQTEESG